MDKNPDVEAGSCSHACIEPFQQASALIQRIRNSLLIRRAPGPGSYPPIASIPRTSPERLAQASADGPDSPIASSTTTSSTVLYLAYGSNLSAETFLGRRGIRPISQLNVSAPAFDLAFDLPGLPYLEPCFANTTPRKLPKPPTIPGDPPKLPLPPPPPPPPVSSSAKEDGNDDGASGLVPGVRWSRGLYGVVYEVTADDYAKIVRTEGGGANYLDVLTPCLALPPPIHVPEKPPFPELPPRPFLAHTLYAPQVPPPKDGDGNENDNGERGGNGDGDDGGDGDGKKHWWQRLLLPLRRPDPAYAQPSPRYLKLIRDGAREHGLPEEYQRYLTGLGAYRPTTWRQEIGRLLVGVFFLPLFVVLIALGALLADEEGRVPKALGVAMLVAVNALWMVYDAVLKPVFGDGERTVVEDDGDADAGTGAGSRRRSRRLRGSRG
ncbi:hypothetical protein F5B20DRAFT_480134 [Whalleya microplaca]|nr:hypothetical protein F5B20DRAFT_480134 [Whalleya microplaca]